MSNPLGLSPPQLREYQILAISRVHILFTAFLPNLENTGLCPNPDRVNSKYFSWNSYTVMCFAIIFIAGSIRLYTFKALGKNFTFELAKPDKLTTDGIYAYVQHPSYGPDYALSVTNIALFCNVDGVLKCYLPVWAVEFWVGWKWVLLGLFTAAYWTGMAARIRDEEGMLRETFGKDWEVWHQKTARLIPGVF
ncbi:hypothetical protein EJ08DRAFT_593758 [Tothia fuscella]|uniref:Protein-S-isoprenylcysteine O-methyltransferase n=1 Tax=Tothia fuscella TaxID=1048955 RepID=A0A9P4NL94_9PEZI|nr:hypothetical protein EJ08DRAFT_593758 [Tothia fuscella]